ncbi:hypothetical protein F5Y06DRAFT_294658 [Hypoxylon sp. FL0890]|nr:hypothetical protein F5Y06DRAFT_294658 [Hypoxylon sp. FL0890]
MQFSLSSILVTLAVVSSATAAVREGTTKRSADTTEGECNGTSCQVGFDNFECNKGSCAGPKGGDGKRCTVVDNPDGSTTSWCPGCSDPNLC